MWGMTLCACAVLFLSACGRLSDSNTTSTQALVPPATPQRVGVTNTYDALVLSWDASSGASSYQVLYGLASGTDLSQVTISSNATQYAFYGLTNYQKYRFMVKAINTVGESAYSTEIDATPEDITAPSKPTDFYVQSVAASSVASANGYLSWKNPKNKDFNGVIVVRRDSFAPSAYNDSSATVVYQGDQEHFADTSIQTGKRYYYRVYAYDKVNNYSEGTSAMEVIIP